MVAAQADAATWGGTSASSPLNIVANSIPTPASTTVQFIIVGFTTVGPAITAINITSPSGATASFLRLALGNGGGRSYELWMVYNCAGFTANPVYQFVWSGAGTILVQARNWAVDSACNVAPTTTASSSNSGTSVTANSGTITPVAGDLIVAGGVWAVAAASTARTSSGNTFVFATDRSGSVTGVSVAVAIGPTTAVASQLSWTITSAAWLGAIVSLTMPAPAAAGAAFVYKGRDTAAADAPAALP